MFNHLPRIIPSTQVFGGRISWDPEEGESVLLSCDCPLCSVCPPLLWSLTGWTRSCFCHQFNTWYCSGSTADSSFAVAGTMFLIYVPMADTSQGFCQFPSPAPPHFPQVWRMLFVSPGWVTDGHRILGCPCHVSHHEDASGICIQAILLPGSLQKAKEAFFSLRLMAPLTIRICSISKSGQRQLDRKASFPDSDSTQ